MEAIRYALDDLVILGPEPEAAAAAEVEEAAPEAELVEAASEVAAPAAAEVVEVVPQPSEDEAAMEYSFDENEPAPAPIKPPRIPQPAVIEEPEVPALVAPVEEDGTPRRKPKVDHHDEPEFEAEPDLEQMAGPKKSAKKAGKKKRQLVFDEDRGEVVAKKHRKGGRQRGEWDEYLD